MSIFNRRPILTGSIIAVAALLMVPFAYLAGWLGDLGQVAPALSTIAAAHENLVWRAAHQPQEPPAGTPHITAQWTDSSVTLAWSAVPHAASYTIYRAPGTESFQASQAIARVSPQGTPSFTDASVEPGTPYTYWVAATNAAGQGPASPALSVHTYLSWAAIAQRGEAAARTIHADQWSRVAWGIFGQTQKSVSGPVWNVGGQLESPLTVQASASTWLTARGTTWSIGHTAVTAHAGASLTQFTGSAAVPELPLGPATPSDLAVWQQDGHWVTAIVSPTTSPLPPQALLLNNYGQAVGLVTSSGSLVHG